MDDRPPEERPPAPQPDPGEERLAASWAQSVPRLKVTADVPRGGINLNVNGRLVNSPLQGFGQLWQKTYRVRLAGAKATPAEVIKTWKVNFPAFWPKGNRFYAPLSGIKPGEVAVLNLAVPGVNRPLLSTGVMVLYADDVSFTFMTPEGHMLSGWITFSAYEEEDCTVAQAEALVRATDPIYEIGMRVAGSSEDQFWQHTLTALARHFGVSGQVQTRITLLDPKMQWSQAGNIWHNAGIRSFLYFLATPLRWIKGLFRQ